MYGLPSYAAMYTIFKPPPSLLKRSYDDLGGRYHLRKKSFWKARSKHYNTQFRGFETTIATSVTSITHEMIHQHNQG